MIGETLEQFFNRLVAFASSTAISTGRLQQMYIAEKSSGLELAFGDPRLVSSSAPLRDQLKPLVAIFEYENIVRYGAMSEAWIVYQNSNEEIKVRPRDDSRRIEAIIVSVATSSHALVTQLEIVRAHGRISNLRVHDTTTFSTKQQVIRHAGLMQNLLTGAIALTEKERKRYREFWTTLR